LLPGGHRRRDKSGHKNKAKQVRDTHKLKGVVERGQDTEREQASEGHSLSEGHKRRDKSGHENKVK
jgi:hypothetical protein